MVPHTISYILPWHHKSYRMWHHEWYYILGMSGGSGLVGLVWCVWSGVSGLGLLVWGIWCGGSGRESSSQATREEQGTRVERLLGYLGARSFVGLGRPLAIAPE